MKKSHRRRRRPQTRLLDFQLLEPRKMLAGDATGLHQVANNLPTGLNLVVNGDFESFTAGSDNFYGAGEVSGWTGRQLNSSVNNPREFLDQNGFTGNQVNEVSFLNLFNYSASYGSVLDLDSTAFDLDSVTQNVPTVTGKQYLLTFDFSAHPTANPTADARSYDFEVLWNGEVVATYTGGDLWHTGALVVTGGNGATSELTFAEIREGRFDAGDGLGALLDNIRVVEFAESTVLNGSYEQTPAISDSFELVNQTDIAGWNAIDPIEADRVLKIQKSSTSDGARSSATDGTQFLNLDSAVSKRDVVFSDFSTVDGAAYYLTFAARRDGTSIDSTDELRVRWGDAWAATVRAGEDWQSFGLLLNGNSDVTRLFFLEPGDGNNGDGSGPFIDNVRLLRVDPVAVNDPPVIEPLADQSADFGLAAALSVSATDPENQTISYSISATGIPTGHNQPTISDTGAINWNPSKSGTVTLTVTATDSLGAASNMTFNVNVANFIPGSQTGSLTAVPTQFRAAIYGTTPPSMSIDSAKNYEARFQTTAGLITVNLFADLAPVTVNNFVTLARDGFYDGLNFHRVIAGFAAQGGDPLGTGGGGPGYQFADETSNGLTFNSPGLLAMANAGPGTNGSQFFFTFATPTFLNGNHTIFGEIVGDDTALQSVVITHDVKTNGTEIPRAGITKTVINSITIIES